MSLGFDIGQGAGLAGATGVRPFLPPILTGALASGDIGVDFDGTSFDWVESPGFLIAVLALSVAVYLYDRRAPKPAPGERSQVQAVMVVVAMVLGAVLFGASLSEGGQTEWPGVIAGMLCALLGFAAVALLFARARATDSSAMCSVIAWKVSRGNVLVSGSPPANEITSGRVVIDIMSRIADDFMTRVRDANRPA